MPLKPLIPSRQIARLRSHLATLSTASQPADALAALFLLQSEAKDCLKRIPGEAAKVKPIQPIPTHD